jgi:hypothetical protein
VVLFRVMSNGVMSEYNLNGKLNKLSFRKTNTMKLIIGKLFLFITKLEYLSQSYYKIRIFITKLNCYYK